MRSKKRRRHRFLLDEGLPPRESFPLLNNYHDIKHIKHDLKQSGSKDPIVYKIAEKQRRMMMVLNTKDFRPLIKINKPSVIAISSQITNQQIDLKMSKMLKNIKPSELKGHLISISNSGVTIQPMVRYKN